MEKKREELLVRIRKIALETGVERVTIDRLCLKLQVSKEELFSQFNSEEDLMASVLEYERDQFEKIIASRNFKEYCAIDALLEVSKEMANKFDDISPKVTHGLSKYFPKIYAAHTDERVQYVYDKIKKNLEQGVIEGVYRSDFKPELISRLYISRLLDVLNPELFPPEEFSFEIVYSQMIESFLRGITTPEGLKYFLNNKHKVNP
ncbi:MAG: TetR/AcrR family transcriptional regulator [Bacteroidales bacterium]